jgi:hypothetical protein
MFGAAKQRAVQSAAVPPTQHETHSTRFTNPLLLRQTCAFTSDPLLLHPTRAFTSIRILDTSLRNNKYFALLG